MAMPTSTERPAPVPGLAVARCVAGPPRRSADAAWAQIADLVGRTFGAYGYPETAALLESMRQLQPLGRLLLVVHLIEQGAGSLEFAAGELKLAVSVGYDGGDEDLSTPPVEVLSPLAAGSTVALRVRLARSFDAALLERLISAARAGSLAVTVVAPGAAPGSAAPEPAPVPDARPFPRPPAGAPSNATPPTPANDAPAGAAGSDDDEQEDDHGDH